MVTFTNKYLKAQKGQLKHIWGEAGLLVLVMSLYLTNLITDIGLEILDFHYFWNIIYRWWVKRKIVQKKSVLTQE